MKYGWYSEKVANQYGSAIYESYDGKDVEVTIVSSTPNLINYLWDDVVEGGPVKQYLRQGQRGQKTIRGLLKRG